MAIAILILSVLVIAGMAIHAQWRYSRQPHVACDVCDYYNTHDAERCVSCGGHIRRGTIGRAP